jgi:hypothetical protein
VSRAAELPVPEDVRSPAWIESRRVEQLATRPRFQVFCDFQFTDERERSGIRFQHRIVDDAGNRYKAVHYDHGHGLAAADVDNDGKLDLYFVNQVGPCELWRNRGDGTFEDITARAGVAIPDSVKVGASFADYDNDGDADLFVTTVRGGNRLFQNLGDGRFADVSNHARLNYSGHSSAGVFFDFDRDGLLDLYLCNVGVYTTDTLTSVTNYEGFSNESALSNYPYYEGFTDAFAGHLKAERTETSVLYRNVDGKRFEDVSQSMGLVDEGWTGDASPLDANGDSWPDLYVLNMQGHDHYYENDRGKRFVEKTAELFPKTPWGSMGIKVFDYDNNGNLDLYVTDMHSDMSRAIDVAEEKAKSRMLWPEALLRSEGKSIYGNAFYKREGSDRYQEVSDSIGAENYWPWGLSAGDLNADGFEDVFITASMNYPYRYGVNSVLLNNRGDAFLDSEYILGVEPRREGKTAKPWFVLDCSGKDKGHKHCEGASGVVEVWGALGSRSSAILDIDSDGDLDIITNDFNSQPMVLLSNLSERRSVHFLQITLRGTKSNRDGLGAVVTVAAAGNHYTKVHDGKSGYLSQSRQPLYFGLGEASVAEQIIVSWPSGRRQVVDGPFASGQTIEIAEPAD